MFDAEDELIFNVEGSNISDPGFLVCVVFGVGVGIDKIPDTRVVPTLGPIRFKVLKLGLVSESTTFEDLN